MKFWIQKGAWASKKAKKKAKGLTPEGIKSVAIIRHAALGDMVLVRAFIYEVKRFFPQASITLSIVTNYQLGTPIDMVDRVHIVPGHDQRHIGKVERYRHFKNLGYHDLIFDLAATNRSYWLCFFTRAKLKIGFPYRKFLQYVLYDAVVCRSDLKFEAENMLEMLSMLGAKTQYPPRFDLPGERAHREKAYIVYFTSASDKSKCWPDSHFAQLLDRMVAKHPGYEHILLEGVADWETVQPILGASRQKEKLTVIKGGKLDDTIALLKGARLVVSNDTGIRNLAITTETPTVGIFFCTVPYRYWPRYSSHDVVFEPSGEIPGVDAVYAAIEAALAKGQLQ